MVLPVTPESFSVTFGIKTETVSIHTMGDVALPGLPISSTIPVDCMFPYHAYPFSYDSGDYSDPYEYIEQLKAWTEGRNILRYVISDTGINLPVFIETVKYSEKDGTNDVYASIILRPYRELKAVKSLTNTVVRSSADREKKTTVKTYRVVRGDTMWAIARAEYGDPTLCWKLADYNGKKDANILMVDEVLKLPPREALV